MCYRQRPFEVVRVKHVGHWAGIRAYKHLPTRRRHYAVKVRLFFYFFQAHRRLLSDHQELPQYLRHGELV